MDHSTPQSTRPLSTLFGSRLHQNVEELKHHLFHKQPRHQMRSCDMSPRNNALFSTFQEENRRSNFGFHREAYSGSLIGVHEGVQSSQNTLRKTPLHIDKENSDFKRERSTHAKKRHKRHKHKADKHTRPEKLEKPEKQARRSGDAARSQPAAHANSAIALRSLPGESSSGGRNSAMLFYAPEPPQREHTTTAIPDGFGGVAGSRFGGLSVASSTEESAA